MAKWSDPDVQVLRALREAGERGVSLDDLANFSLVAVDSLRAAGCVIDGPPESKRYRLVTVPTRLIADDVRGALPEEAVVGSTILTFGETGSTNDLAAQAGRDGLAEGLVIFAESQRAGRGRLGRKWISPPEQNLLFSVLLRPMGASERWADLTFAAALAVAETAAHFTGKPARIKWPNDVLVEGRKIAGILLEAHQARTPGFVVVGIGLNVLQGVEDFPPELREHAGSLAMLASRPRDRLQRRDVAAFVLARLDKWYKGWPDRAEEIRVHCARLGCVAPPQQP